MTYGKSIFTLNKIFSFLTFSKLTTLYWYFLVLKEGLACLNDVLKNLEPLHKPLDPPGGSVLLRELVNATADFDNGGEAATTNPQATPLLHHMAAAHAYIQMFVTVNRTGQNDIRNILVSHIIL